jgi:protein-tyrosine phosphatase
VGESPVEPPTARVLVVCTANICRSPTAAGLLAARLGPTVEVVSRGVDAMHGMPMCARSADWLAGGGAGVTPYAHRPHVSAPLTLEDVRAATVILTASPRHRSAVVSLRPSAQVRTFTLAQAARIATWRAGQGARPPAGDVADRLLWLAEELDEHRAAGPLPAEDADDLPDPHEGVVRHAEVLPRIRAAVDAVCSPILALAPP